MPTLCVSCFKPTSLLMGAWYLVRSGNLPVVPLHSKCRSDFEYGQMIRTEYSRPLEIDDWLGMGEGKAYTIGCGTQSRHPNEPR